MSSKKSRERRAIEELMVSAHSALHLLLDLASAITNVDAAGECRNSAEHLTRSLRRVQRETTK